MEELVNKFVCEKVININTQYKSIVFLGSIEGKDALITLEKSNFTNSIDTVNNVEDVSPINGNDIYYWGMSQLKKLESEPDCKINLIYPATAKHIQKYQAQEFHMVTETPELYEKIVQPYIETMRGDRIQWVKNILMNKYEADKIIYQDDDFVLLPDMKWDGTMLESLYLVCIVKREDIASLRDLNESHIEYLDTITKRIRLETSKHYKIGEDRLRLFVHYQPSYYHFHIHVVNAAHPGLGNGIAAGKLNLVEDIIDSLKFLGPKGYKARTLSYVIGENHDLWGLGINGSL